MRVSGMQQPRGLVPVPVLLLTLVASTAMVLSSSSSLDSSMDCCAGGAGASGPSMLWVLAKGDPICMAYWGA